MGVVFRARDVELDREVALKVVELQGDEDELERFRREGISLAQLRHPHVVEVHDLGAAEGRAYLAMAYVRGESLAERLRRGHLAAREAAELVALLADAVAHAHAAGVLHRDLKPANVLLDDEGRARLTDFGLAKVRDASRQLTATGGVLGTPAFMAPEQIRDAARVDERADVYGLGAILYAALCAQPPFSGPTAINVLHAVLEGELTPPRELAPDLDPALEALTLRALARDPADRPASAAELAAGLRAWLGGEGSAPSRARRPWALAALALVLVGVGLVGVGLALAQGSTSGASASPSPAAAQAAPSPEASAAAGGSARWSEPKGTFTHPGGIVREVRFLGSGGALSVGGKWIALWDLAAGRVVRKWRWEHHGEVWSVAIDPTGQRFVCGGGESARVPEWGTYLALGAPDSERLEAFGQASLVFPRVDQLDWSGEGLLIGDSSAAAFFLLPSLEEDARFCPVDLQHATALGWLNGRVGVLRWDRKQLRLRQPRVIEEAPELLELPGYPVAFAGVNRREVVVACLNAPQDQRSKLLVVSLQGQSPAVLSADEAPARVWGLAHQRGWVYAASEAGTLSVWDLARRERLLFLEQRPSLGELSASLEGREVLVVERGGPRFEWWDFAALER